MQDSNIYSSATPKTRSTTKKIRIVPVKSLIAILISYIGIGIITLSMLGYIVPTGYLGVIIILYSFLWLPISLCLFVLQRGNIRMKLFVRIHMWGAIVIGGLLTMAFLLGVLGVFSSWAQT